MARIAKPSAGWIFADSVGMYVGSNAGISTRHLGGANIAFCDGHVEWMRYENVPVYHSPTPFLSQAEWFFWAGGDPTKKYGNGTF